MMSSKKINFFCIMVGIFALLFDQATKFAALAFIPSGTIVPICSCFNLVLVFNFGTSFGLLNPNSAFQSLLIILLTFACMAFLTYMFLKLKTLYEKLLCSILIGGAIGNLLDRFVHGAVIDFMDVYYQSWHWPAFNFADVFISCGVIILILYNLFSKNA